MLIQKEIETLLRNSGAEFVHFVDISALEKFQNKGLPGAILFGKLLSPEFIQTITDNPFYVKEMIQNKQIESDEFHKLEKETDQLADTLSEFIISKGYSAYSQSEQNIFATGFYDEEKKQTPLPHKTIALLAGLGWIGKHNLLVTKKYGSAISMCSVLTNAPLETSRSENIVSECGECIVCVDACDENAITGNMWEYGKAREHLVDVSKCTTCIRCLALCPWTQKYRKNRLTRF